MCLVPEIQNSRTSTRHAPHTGLKGELRCRGLIVHLGSRLNAATLGRNRPSLPAAAGADRLWFIKWIPLRNCGSYRLGAPSCPSPPPPTDIFAPTTVAKTMGDLYILRAPAPESTTACCGSSARQHQEQVREGTDCTRQPLYKAAGRGVEFTFSLTGKSNAASARRPE